MDCLHPINIKNPKKDLDPWDTARVLVPCGKCAACLINRSNSWAFRINQELKHCSNAFFVTLTYHDRCLPKYKGVPVVSSEDIRKFHYRLRKLTPGIRLFFISEYSPEPLFRPHYHAIYFNLDVPSSPLHVTVKQYLAKYWKFGLVDVREVDAARIKYLANYSVGKRDLPEIYTLKKTKPFFRVSQHFGENYITDKVRSHLKKNLNLRVANEEYTLSLPRYYRDKVFDDNEKWKLSAAAAAYRRKQHEEESWKEEFSEDVVSSHEAKVEFERNYFERHKKRSRYLTRNIE